MAWKRRPGAFGVAQAFGDSVPIVVIPGGYPRKIAGITPNFSSTLNYRHVTKWAEWSARWTYRTPCAAPSPR